MISIIIVYLAVKFGYPILGLLVLITWIPDVIIVAGLVDIIEKIIGRKWKWKISKILKKTKN